MELFYIKNACVRYVIVYFDSSVFAIRKGISLIIYDQQMICR